MKVIQQDICIVGAGPGGAATAIKLHHQGMHSLLLDKSEFPRDKVCGDALSGKAITILNRIDPAIVTRFKTKWEQEDVWGMRLVAPNHTELDIPFRSRYDKNAEPAPGYVCRRMQFDHFMVEEVKRCDSIDFRTGVEIDSYEKNEDGFLLKDKSGKLSVQCRLLIMANGAQSAFSRKYAGIEKEPKHYAGAVRAYFKNVKGFHADGFIELHFLKEYTPGYFWAFPLPDNSANVGLGLRTDFITKKRLNLKKSLLDIVKNHPALKDRFAEAELDGNVKGFPLPLGSKKYPISGDNFMLVGDAGHLIDPLTGEGIGNAIYSGWIAAEQAKVCFENENFSASVMKAYDTRVARVLGSEMKLSYQMQKMLTYPWLMNLFANRLVKSKKLLDILSRMYTDFELRRQLVNPLFWMKLAMRKE